MVNEIDALMDLDPLEMSDVDIDAIIAYQRKARANAESGVKPKKAGSSGPKVTLDLAALGLLKTEPKVAGPSIKRRI